MAKTVIIEITNTHKKESINQPNINQSISLSEPSTQRTLQKNLTIKHIDKSRVEKEAVY